MSIRDVVLFCFDTDTTELRMFGGFGWILLGLYECGKIQLRYTKMYWEIRHESVKNTPKHLRFIYESCTKQREIRSSSWQFVSFSLYNWVIKCHSPLLGHYFQNKCLSESRCCIGSTFGVSIPTVEGTKKTVSKKKKERWPGLFFTFWLEKLLVKVYHHHQPVEHQSLTVLINLPLLFHSWNLCVFVWRGSYSEWMPSFPSSLISLLVFSV